MGDIEILNPLQTEAVPACGRVRSRDLWNAGGVRSCGFIGRHASVGIILLDVRYGKRGTHELDDLAHRRAPRAHSLPWDGWIDTEVEQI